jgi:hypothetical protein
VFHKVFYYKGQQTWFGRGHVIIKQNKMLFPSRSFNKAPTAAVMA